MAQETFIITLPPRQGPSLQGWNVLPAHLAYRVGRGGRLLRAGGGSPPRGGLMVLGDQGYDGQGPVPPLCQEVLRECQGRGFSGAVLDFERGLPPLEQIARQLDDLFFRRGLSLYVPEACGPHTRHARVMIPSALSGGSLTQRLEEAGSRFGRGRIALALQRTAEDFFLPSPTGCGHPLTREELAQLQQRLHPCVFFSDQLCARYFTYMSRDSGAHFVLFDDGDTLRRKMEVARQAGIHSFLAPWADVEDCLHTLCLQKAAPAPKSLR